MDDFQLDSALVEAVEAGHEARGFRPPPDGEHDLLPQGVFLLFIDGEVSGQALVQEGVEVFKDDFH